MPAEAANSPCWAPQPGPQTEAIRRTWVTELLFGGARGGGKSDYLLGDFLQDVQRYGSAWQGVLFRRTYPELQEIIGRAKAIMVPSGATWKEAAKEWSWPNGACLRMRYLERDDDATRYQGHQYSWIGWDELGQWPSDSGYRQLIACLRSAYLIPTKRIRASANPGGAGHSWVKRRWGIDSHPRGRELITDPATGMSRMFVPSRVGDNLILLAHDPGYTARLKGVGSETLVEAWLDGDWSVVMGAFFDCWSTEKHVVAPFAVPVDWLRFRAFDWGFARPFSVGWWAVSDGSLLPDGRRYPAGCLVNYREWYGSAGEPNEGLRLTAEEVADGIRERDGADKIAYSVADPSCFAQDGGPSIAERMLKRRVIFRPADNARVARGGAVGGWDQMRARLVGEDGKAMMVFFSTCRDAIRTIPSMQHDPDRPEDMDTDGEDHAADMARYAAMSRPYQAWKPAVVPPKHEFAIHTDGGIRSGLTIRELIDRLAKRRSALS